MPSRYEDQPLDITGLDTYPLASRKSKVGREQLAKRGAAGGSFDDFWRSLPDILAAADLRELARRVRSARERERAAALSAARSRGSASASAMSATRPVCSSSIRTSIALSIKLDIRPVNCDL